MDIAAAAAAAVKIGTAQMQNRGRWPAAQEQATNQSCGPQFPSSSRITPPVYKTLISKTTLKSFRCLVIPKYHSINHPYASLMTDFSLSLESLRNPSTYGERAKNKQPEREHVEGIQLTTCWMAKPLTLTINPGCHYFDIANHGGKTPHRKQLNFLLALT